MTPDSDAPQQPEPPLQASRESAAHAAARAAQSSRLRHADPCCASVTRLVREQPAIALVTTLVAGILIGWCAARCDY